MQEDKRKKFNTKVLPNEVATNHLKSDEIKSSTLMVSRAQSPLKTPLGTGNKHSKPHPSMASRSGIEPGPHWQKSRAPITMSLISVPCATKFITFNRNDLHSFAMLLKQKRKKDLKIFLCYCLISVAKLQRSLTGKLFPSAIQMKFH